MFTASEVDHIARAGLLLEQGYPVHSEDYKDAVSYVNAVKRDDYTEADRLLVEIRRKPRHLRAPKVFVDIGG